MTSLTSQAPVQRPSWLRLTGSLVWKDGATWLDALTAWLTPRLKVGALDRLRGRGMQDTCWDDPDWLDLILEPETDDDLEAIFIELGDALDRVTARTYHGCRVADAGVFHSQGLLLNDPSNLECEVRKIVAEEEALAWMRPTLDDRLAAIDFRDRDRGRLYLSLDDRRQLDDVGHYALYGSEWITAFFASSGREVLRSRGVPTILEVDLPLSWTSPSTRDELGKHLLLEWTRQQVNMPDWIPARDFSFILRQAIPPAFVVGHYHPKRLKCPFESRREFVSASTLCPSCLAVAEDHF